MTADEHQDAAEARSPVVWTLPALLLQERQLERTCAALPVETQAEIEEYQIVWARAVLVRQYIRRMSYAGRLRDHGPEEAGERPWFHTLGPKQREGVA